MGKGNCCVFGKYEGLFFVDWSNFSTEWEDEDGNVVTNDYDFQRDQWEDALCEFVEDYQARFPSFSKCDKWISSEQRAVLENKLFYIATEDNECSMAVKLIQKEQGGNIEAMQKRHYQTYLEGIKECLFNQFESLGTYSGAWTSGTIKRPLTV